MREVDFGPYYRYDRSPIWRLHDDYFQTRGLKAWSRGEVPYSGICNFVEAYKKARFLIDNFKQLEQCSDFANQRIFILEVGAGYGEFALNFLAAFKEICVAEQLNYMERLSYVISDYSQKTLDELKNSNRLDAYRNILDFARFDVLDKFSWRTASDALLERDKFDAIFANYLLDQLPARIFARAGDKYYEKYLSIENQEIYAKKKSWLGKNFWIKKMKKKHEFREINWQEELSLEHRDILDTCFKRDKPSTIVYSYGALEAIKNFLYLLKPTGILICSDFNASAKPGFDSFEPCYYGNSLAQAVNYEFVFKYFMDAQSNRNRIDHKIIGKNLGHQLTLIYEDPIKPLHTFFLTRPDYPGELELGAIYKKVYQQNWFLRSFYRFLVELQLGFYILLLLILSFFVFNFVVNAM